MKKQLFSTLLLLVFININNSEAQSNYYFANNQRQYWLEDSTSINIIVANMQNYNLIVRNLETYFSANNDTVRYADDDNNIIVISDRLRTMDLSNLIFSISPGSMDVSFVTYAKRINNKRIWLRNEAYVKLKNDAFYSSYLLPLLSHFNNYTLDYDSEENDYRITCNNETELLQIANGLYDTQYVYYSTPDFYCEMSLNTIDPYYGDQWALNNTGQEGGEAGVDIKAEKAWEFLQHYNNNLGDSIRVAVIDDGVDTAHEDLKDALGHRRVLNGFPSLYGQGAHRTSSQYHGTACAGIIAASHNNIGVAGIAPNALIVPIRIQRGKNHYFSARRIQKAITKAWEEYNAEILNVAWIGQFIDLFPVTFRKAMDQGRGGKGCVIVVASGNSGTSIVEYPADVGGVIAVGAADRCGFRAGYSNGWTSSCDAWNNVGASSYGSKLSVVAPGSHIYTIDPRGTAGFLNGDYNPNFYGTSAACSHVSGVVALILSVNPNLTHAQVKEIIEKTAQKVGPYYYESNSAHPNGTWHEEMGYGMINAIRALAEAKIYGTEYAISGLPYMQLCNEYTYTLSGNVPEGFDIVWEVNPQMAIVSGQGTSTLVVRPIYPAMYNWLRAKICFEGETIREEFMDNIVSTGSGYQLVIPHDSVLTQNALWNIERTLANTAIVDSGAVLTITNTIHCTDNARLIVRPGGKLVVDGGTLTSACAGEMWQGIEVLGNPEKRQIPQWQGVVELKNGATIENAHCAILTGLHGDSVYVTTGGIIQADSAFFINNRRSVAFMSYTNYSPAGIVMNNQSYFYRCVFTVNDDNLFGQDNGPFIDHVTMWKVRGVKFRGCTFNNLTTGNSGDRRHGIYTEDAGFSLDTYCRVQYYDGCECPENKSSYCVFSGFATAVEVNTSGRQHSVEINRTEFTNNDVGVRINGNHYATITRNRFDMTGSASRYSTGLVLDNCTGYKVEENFFEGGVNYLGGSTTGILVNNNSNSPNIIYRDTFNTLTYGIRFMSNNSGVEAKCNTFDGNETDIYVCRNSTMASSQGSQQISAGNLFCHTIDYNISNNGFSTINYYYSGTPTLGNLYYPNLYSGSVTLSSSMIANSCVSTLCNDGGGQYLAGFQSDMDAFTAASANQSPADGTDGGGVGQTLSETAFALSETYYTAVRTLMADSVLDLNTLEQWHTAAQPIADPYSLTETRFMEGYSEPFVADADDAELANYAEFHAMKLALRGQYDNTDNQDNNNINLSNSQNSPTINWYALTPAQIAQLQTIAERNTGRASVMAKGVLCFFFGICYDDDLLADDNQDNQGNQGDAETRSAKAVQQDEGTNLTVYPNPTDDVLYIELSGMEIANVALYDLQGRAVETLRATSLQGTTATLSLRSVPAGVYLLRVTDTNGREHHQKIVKK